MKFVFTMLTGILVCGAPLFVSAQHNAAAKFGKISPADFDMSKDRYDTSASAVVLSDVGSSRFEGNTKGWFSLIYRRFTRIKILHKSGLDEANISVPLYVNGNATEVITEIRGATYTLSGGAVNTVKLENRSSFKDKMTKHVMVQKFSLPAVTEGCIIDVMYEVKSDFLFNLQPWAFQRDIPVLYSEYETSIPEFFNYVSLAQGMINFAAKEQHVQSGHYNLMLGAESAEASERVSITGNEYVNRFVMKNVPALREEPFTSSVNNYVSKISFQLSQYRFPEMPVKDIMGNWMSANERMTKDESFGADLEKSNNWLDDDMKTITASAKTSLDKAKAIYSWVRDNFTCNDHSEIYMENSLKSVFKARKGSVAEINLLLDAMLRHEKISAYPVILSTREHGLTNELYPLMDKFNYTICTTTIDDHQYFLDASVPYLGFGRLETSCYNGHARVLCSQIPAAIYLQPDSLKESKLVSLYLYNEKGKMLGNCSVTNGYHESQRIRQIVREKGENSFFDNLKKGAEFSILEKSIDSLKLYDYPVSVRYTMALDVQKADMLYGKTLPC